jgi:hypothetical protein
VCKKDTEGGRMVCLNECVQDSGTWQDDRLSSWIESRGGGQHLWH